MAPPRLDRVCAIDGCGRRHAAHGFCLMHYKRWKKHGSPEYRWGGKVVGRACLHCDRPVIAREMCCRHYQMWRKHNDPLYADSKKVDSLPNGEHRRRGYRMVCPVAGITKASPVIDPAVERNAASHRKLTRVNHGFRDGSKRSRREWQHRKIAGAKAGQIVHHIDLDPSNNDAANLHVFQSPREHTLAHRSLEMIAAELLKEGFIGFDAISGVYQRNQSSFPASE